MDLVLEFKQCDDFENAFVCPVFNSQDQTMRHYTNYILETKVMRSANKCIRKTF